MKTGNTKEELFEYLKQIDENTSIDSIVSCGQRITVELKRSKRGIKWDAIETKKQINVNYKKGRSFNDFMTEIDNLDTNMELHYLDILCLKETSPVKTWDGKVKCTFFEIDPYEPYTLNNDGTLFIPTIEYNLSQDEYNQVLETRIAFYDVAGKIYPIKQSAIRSVCTYLDSSALFKKLPAVPLAASMFLAERIADVKKYNIIVRNKTDLVSPVVGVAGSVYKRYSQHEFFKNAFDYIAGKGIYTIMFWRCSDEKFMVELEPYLKTIYSPRIQIISSDTNGTSIQIRGFAKIGPGYIDIFRHVAKKGETIEQMFDGLYEMFTDYDTRLRKKINYRIQPGDFDLVQKAIGQRRARKHHDFINNEHEGSSVGYELAEKIINNTYEKLPFVQSFELGRAYALLMDKYL